MIRIKNIVIFSLWVALFSNVYGVNTLDLDEDSFCGMEATSSATENSATESTPPAPPTPTYESFTIYEDKQDIIFERYFDYEMQHFVFTKTIIEHEPSPFDTNIPQYQTEPLEQSNTSCEQDVLSHDDYFKDFTQDQRQEVLKEAEEQKLEGKRQESGVNQDVYIPKNRNIIREQEVPLGKRFYLGDNRTFDSEIILNNVHTLKDLSNALSSPIVQARFNRINYDFKSKPVRHRRPGKSYDYKKELIFFDALLSGKVAQLINDIQHAPLATAESSFNELKNLWPWKRDYTFSIPNLTEGSREWGFIVILGIDIMHIIEKGLIIRPDYIQAHADKVSLDAIQKCKEECALLQRRNDIRALNEVKQELFHRVLNNGKQGNLTDSICLAIAEKAVLDPVNTVLGRIKNARSLEAARKELHNLEIQLLNYAKRENLTRMSDITARLIEQYGFDLLQTGEEIYRTRPDYVHAKQNQTIFSDSLQTILGNIKHNKLSSAHMELVNANQQIADAFKARNITDPIEQQEHLVKDFGVDLRVLTNSSYQERPDFMNLIKLFTPLDVPSITIDILNNNNDYESVANEFDKVAEQVLDNARLCDLDYIPQVENQLIQSLQIMRSPQNGAEFVFHATVADHLMTDLQCHADAIVKAEQIVRERSSALLARALEKFIVGLNPIEQVKSMVSLAKDAGHLVYATTSLAVDMVLHPMDAVAKIVPSQSSCEFLINTARFACDITFGSLYLSPVEYKVRIDDFKEALSDMPLAHLTAEHWVDLTAQIAADFFFCKGVAGVYRYVKEIEAISKIQQQAGRVAEALKRAVDTHLADNPVLVTTEGVVLKMSDNMHTPPGGPKNVINKSKALLESVYAPIAKQLEKEIRQLKIAFEEYDTFKGKWIKLDFDHVFTLEDLVWKNGKASKLGGFHHDFRGALQNSGAIQIIEKIVSKQNSYYLADVVIDGVCFKNKTFFPSNWSREEVASTIHEVYKNFKNSGAQAILESNGKYKIEVLVEEGVKIRMFITENGVIKSAYPVFEQISK